MERLHLRIPSKDDWWQYFDPNIAGGGIFCPTTSAPQVGRTVRLEITFVAGPRFYIGGTVIWRRVQLGDPRARPGAGIQVHLRDQNKLSYVNAWVRGGVLDKRESRRLPVRLQVTYTGRTGRRISFTRDLSPEGIFLRSQELLDLQTSIRLVLSPPGGGYKPYFLRGVVARLVDDPEERGLGIQLVFDSDEDREHFASFFRRLEESYLAGTLPDDTIA